MNKEPHTVCFFSNSDQQQAALCVSTNLPAQCPYKDEWLDVSSLCSDIVILQVS